MSDNQKTWIQQQKDNKLFRGPGSSGDAIKMLEKSAANRILSAGQGRKIIAARMLGEILGVSCYSRLCDSVEYTQLVIDGQSRQQFMKVAIEQFQGKLAASSRGRVILDNLV